MEKGGRHGATTDARRPIAVDLFAGAGGLSLGLEQAGFDVVTAVEYDPVHAATHEYNFPHTKTLCADIARLDPERLREAIRDGMASHGRDPSDWDGEVDLVAGGPPCQGFSLIGKRLIDDPRNQLVFHYFRLVDALKPRYFVMENVPGMARGGHAGILDELIEEFESAGYRFPEPKYRILNAADFGVPQERHRLFLIGTRGDQSLAVYPHPTVNPVPKRSGEPRPPVKPGLTDGPTVADALRGLPNLTDFPELRNSDEVELPTDALKAMERATSKYGKRLRGLEPDPEDLSYPRMWNPRILTGSMQTAHTPQSIARFQATKAGETEPVSRFYKLDPAGLCNTLRAGSGSERGAFTSPRPIHPIWPRVLSNREAARLHSFPDWFRMHATKWHGFRQIGNAVAPLVGRAIGRQIVAALGVNPRKPSRVLSLKEAWLLKLTMTEAAAHFGASPEEIPAQRTRQADRINGAQTAFDLVIKDASRPSAVGA